VTISVRVSSTWKTVASGLVRVGGAWKAIASAQVYTGGAWKAIPGFAPAMTASISPSEAVGYIFGTGTATSNNVTCSPSGGTAPYSYSWVMVSGGAAPTNPTSATTAFSQSLAYETATGEASCTITDANGTTANASVFYTLTSVDIGGFY
jgi:hypothetical protein